MATLTVYGRTSSGGLTAAASGDTLQVPNTVQSFTGQQLTISSLVGALIIGATGLTIASGSGNVDFSATSGTTSTGTGQVNLKGDTVIATGKTLSAAGSGNINLPNNGSARFQIEGSAVASTVTATNLGTLTAGSSSNADSLHTHAAVAATTTRIAGLTLFSTPVLGELGYFSGNNTVARAIATAIGTSRAVGAYDSVAGSLSTGPRIKILLDAGLTLAAGDPIYVSAATAGRGTNDASGLTAGQVEAQVALLADASSYNSGSGSAQDCLWQPKIPIQL